MRNSQKWKSKYRKISTYAPISERFWPLWGPIFTEITRDIMLNCLWCYSLYIKDRIDVNKCKKFTKMEDKVSKNVAKWILLGDFCILKPAATANQLMGRSPSFLYQLNVSSARCNRMATPGHWILIKIESSARSQNMYKSNNWLDYICIDFYNIWLKWKQSAASSDLSVYCVDFNSAYIYIYISDVYEELISHIIACYWLQSGYLKRR